MHNEGYVVILDDDPLVQAIIESATGKKSLFFPSIAACKANWTQLHPFCFFVDVHLGMENGLDLLPAIKVQWPYAPIIVITQDRNEDTLREALARGADDFIYKPLSPVELLARLQARLDSLAKRESKEVEKFGDLTLDKSHRSLSNQKETRYLSPTEINLLLCLLHAKGTVVPRDVLKKRCWGAVYVSENALNRKLHEVRRTVKELSCHVEITTRYGMGFLLESRHKANIL